MLKVKNLYCGYNKSNIIKNISFSVNKNTNLCIIGPNGSGKSTILKTISRLLKQKSGAIYLEKEDISSMNIKKIAKKMSSLSQHNKSPEDIKVKELIYYGRLPHKRWHERRNKEDDEIIKWAINKTSLNGYEDKNVAELSGGERQRVWIAMALAQKPRILLLDEPTTYLDICHQLEVLELVKSLNKELNLTVIMVLHDLGQAAKYSHKVMVLKNGRLVVEGRPYDVLTQDLIKKVYNVEVCIRKDILKDEVIIHPMGVCKNGEKGCECYNV